MTIDQEIVELKKKLEEVNTKRIQTSTKLAALEEEKNKLLEECKALGVVDPKKIEEDIATQETLLNAELQRIKEQLEGSHVLRT